MNHLSRSSSRREGCRGPYRDLALTCHSAIIHGPVARLRGRFGGHLSTVVGSSAHNDKLDPAPGLLNEQQRCQLELPCGAWVGFSSRQPPASNTNNGFCPGGAGHGGQRPFGKALADTRLVSIFRPPSRLTFPSFLRVEGKKAFRQVDCEICRWLYLRLQLVTLVYEFDDASACTQITSKRYSCL